MGERLTVLRLGLLLALPALLLSVLGSLSYPEKWARFGVGAGYAMILTIVILTFSSQRLKKEHAPSELLRRLARHERNPWGDALLVELSTLVGAIGAISQDLIAIVGTVIGGTGIMVLWAAVDPVGVDDRTWMRQAS